MAAVPKKVTRRRRGGANVAAQKRRRNQERAGTPDTYRHRQNARLVITAAKLIQRGAPSINVKVRRSRWEPKTNKGRPRR